MSALDAEKYQLLRDSNAEVKYTKRRGEKQPYVEVQGERIGWVRRKTLDEALDVILKNRTRYEICL